MLDVSAGTFRCGTCAIPRDKFTLSAGNYPFAVTVAAPGTAAKSYTIPNRGILITLK